MELYLLLIVVGVLGGFLTGLVGLGGGIILAPLLLYAPPAVGLSPLEMKEVARQSTQSLTVREHQTKQNATGPDANHSQPVRQPVGRCATQPNKQQ